MPVQVCLRDGALQRCGRVAGDPGQHNKRLRPPPQGRAQAVPGQGAHPLAQGLLFLSLNWFFIWNGVAGALSLSLSRPAGLLCCPVSREGRHPDWASKPMIFLTWYDCISPPKVIKGLLKFWPKTCSQKEVLLYLHRPQDEIYTFVSGDVLGWNWGDSGCDWTCAICENPRTAFQADC